MKIYEVVCDCNSIGFYFSRAKALAEVRRQIIIDCEFDYPEQNIQFNRMIQEIEKPDIQFMVVMIMQYTRAILLRMMKIKLKGTHPI